MFLLLITGVDHIMAEYNLDELANKLEASILEVPGMHFIEEKVIVRLLPSRDVFNDRHVLHAVVEDSLEPLFVREEIEAAIEGTLFEWFRVTVRAKREFVTVVAEVKGFATPRKRKTSPQAAY